MTSRQDPEQGQAREVAARQGETKREDAVYVLHMDGGEIYIGQSRAAGPEPEAGQ